MSSTPIRYQRPQTCAGVLTAKRDLLHEVARQFAYGTATPEDLAEAAVEFSEALADVAMARMRNGR